MKYSIVLALLLTSCVSVRLEKPVTTSRAKNYSLVSPPSEFQAKAKEGFDRYWINPNNGNTISLQTSCGLSSDPSLAALLQKNVFGINIHQEIQKERYSYNDREALNATYEGKVDGVMVKIQTLVFKKNHCNYTISYFGISEEFASNHSDFKSFLKNFRVQ